MLLEDPVGGPPAGGGHVVGPVVGGGQLGDVLALVAAFGHLLGRLVRASRLSPRRADLPAGVVDVVLAADLVAGAVEHPGQGVAVAAPPAVADVDGPGRVGRDELDLDPFAVARCRGGRSRPRPRSTQLGQGVVQPAVVEPEVDESRTGDLDPVDDVGGRVGAPGPRPGRWPGPGELVPARLALTMATLVDQSPCSRRAGRSRWTASGSASRSRPIPRAATVASGRADGFGQLVTGATCCCRGYGRAAAATGVATRCDPWSGGTTVGPRCGRPAG